MDYELDWQLDYGLAKIHKIWQNNWLIYLCIIEKYKLSYRIVFQFWGHETYLQLLKEEYIIV